VVTFQTLFEEKTDVKYKKNEVANLLNLFNTLF